MGVTLPPRKYDFIDINGRHRNTVITLSMRPKMAIMKWQGQLQQLLFYALVHVTTPFLANTKIPEACLLLYKLYVASRSTTLVQFKISFFF